MTKETTFILKYKYLQYDPNYIPWKYLKLRWTVINLKIIRWHILNQDSFRGYNIPKEWRSLSETTSYEPIVALAVAGHELMALQGTRPGEHTAPVHFAGEVKERCRLPVRGWPTGMQITWGKGLRKNPELCLSSWAANSESRKDWQLFLEPLLHSLTENINSL